jgi:hypothetical protein
MTQEEEIRLNAWENLERQELKALNSALSSGKGSLKKHWKNLQEIWRHIEAIKHPPQDGGIRIFETRRFP